MEGEHGSVLTPTRMTDDDFLSSPSDDSLLLAVPPSDSDSEHGSFSGDLHSSSEDQHITTTSQTAPLRHRSTPFHQRRTRQKN